MADILFNPQEYMTASREIETSKHCSRVLFFDGDYSNFDFIQLLIIACCLVLLCALSFQSGIVAGARKLYRFCRKAIGDAAIVLREMGQMLLKQLKVVRWALSTHVWSWNRDRMPDLPRRYPRNPFRDPLYNAHSEEYDLREVSKTTIVLR